MLEENESRLIFRSSMLDNSSLLNLAIMMFEAVLSKNIQKQEHYKHKDIF